LLVTKSTTVRFCPLPRWLAAFSCALALAASPKLVSAFGFDDVAARAQAEAAVAYRPPPQVPKDLAALSYDQYRDIRFKPSNALWRGNGLPFEVMFFHPGGFFKEPVAINEIVAGKARHIRFDPADFDYGKNQLLPSGWADVGYAGFRVHYPLNTPTYKDELAVFLGASYFRAVGGGQRYGLSARGLGLDTTGAAREEFPRFKEFWIERPAANARELVVHALLDSPRATGAYRFTLVPGTQSQVQVRARIFLRAGVTTLGIAPLTSMFHHGENTRRQDDFRPEVHDSDGLMLATGDGEGGTEWLWRPLVNPGRAVSNSFAVRELRGFGLMQRDRAFANYEDLEARYERRPSAWVVPEGRWGAGHVELLLLPTSSETDDNIVAFWVPSQQPQPGQPLDLAYRIVFQGDEQQRPPNGWTVQSRFGRGYVKQGKEKQDKEEFQYVVDFAGPALDALPAEASVQAVVTPGGNARLLERNAYRNEATGAWRMTVRVQRIDPAQPVELRAFLQQDQHALTETWTTFIPAD